MSRGSQSNGHSRVAEVSGAKSAVRLAGTNLGSRAHICAFFSGEDEAFEVLLPFMQEGFELGEKACHTLAPDRRQEHLNRLTSAGLHPSELQQRDQLEIRDWNDILLNGPDVDPARVLAAWETVAESGRQKGYPLTRFITHMEWFFETAMDASSLLEYEARTNEIWIHAAGPIDPVVCVYDLRRFSGEVVINVMRTHPLIVIGGNLQENPFFVHPEEFLKSLQRK